MSNKDDDLGDSPQEEETNEITEYKIVMFRGYEIRTPLNITAHHYYSSTKRAWILRYKCIMCTYDWEKNNSGPLCKSNWKTMKNNFPPSDMGMMKYTLAYYKQASRRYPLDEDGRETSLICRRCETEPLVVNGRTDFENWEPDAMRFLADGIDHSRDQYYESRRF
jgi:hypothetical protein